MRKAIEKAMRAAGAELMNAGGYAVRSKEGDHNYVTDQDVRMQELLRASFTRTRKASMRILRTQ